LWEKVPARCGQGEQTLPVIALGDPHPEMRRRKLYDLSREECVMDCRFKPGSDDGG
jgi:hypothetical protein